MLASLPGLFLFCKFYHPSLISFFFVSLCIYPCLSLPTTHSVHYINVIYSELIYMLCFPLLPSILGHLSQPLLYFYKWDGNIYSVQSCQMGSLQIKVTLEVIHKNLASLGVGAGREPFLCGLSTLSVILVLWAVECLLSY